MERRSRQNDCLADGNRGATAGNIEARERGPRRATVPKGWTATGTQRPRSKRKKKPTVVEETFSHNFTARNPDRKFAATPFSIGNARTSFSSPVCSACSPSSFSCLSALTLQHSLAHAKHYRGLLCC